ncbi:MAG TPA: outer membrane beta-barrel protein [Puia sp.]|nr:outer membrane beta-barrel protein [Puia sp.]
MRCCPLLYLLLVLPIWASAQQPDTTTHHPTPFLTVSGAADGYYRYDLARSAKNDLTSFTHSHNRPEFGMAEVKLEHQTTRIDILADLAAGPRENEYAVADNGLAKGIKQLYVSYSPTGWLKFTAGTWATHLCYESPDAAANRNYSMSYMFSNDPFSHTGIKTEATVGKNGFMIGIANPSNYRVIPDSDRNNKNIIAQYSYAPNEKLKICLNYVGGRDVTDNRSHQYDLVVTAKTSNEFSLGLNATINRSSLATEKYEVSHTWYGSALYLNLDPHPWLGFTLRTEYFSDNSGICLPAPANVIATTLSANFKVAHAHLTLIPEFRIDEADNPIFYHADGSPTRAAASFLLAAVFSL